MSELKQISHLQFKRGNKADLEAVLIYTNKPKAGEPVFEKDTNKIKLGDGIHNYIDLPYLAFDIPDEDIIIEGYYNPEDQKFYKDSSFTERIIPNKRRLYLDLISSLLYYVKAVGIERTYHPCISIATSITYGVSKLYDSLGQNIDGSINQQALTNILKKKCEISEEIEEETLTFSYEI